MSKFTTAQQNVIDYRGKNMLVSASAGTGKTTVMIERIAALIADGVDVSELVVVTFTNLAAAEMKKRLYDKLSERSNDRRIAEQLERLDNASICTIDSFCSELLRNYFYVVDIDPSFTVLDSVTVASLRKNALDDLFKEYFKQGDENFKKVYQIFASKRREENFKNTLMRLYDFSRCLPDFDRWHQRTRENFLNLNSENNPVVQTVLKDISQNVRYFAHTMAALAEKCATAGLEKFAEICKVNAENLSQTDTGSLESALFGLGTFKLLTLPNRSKKDLYGVDKQTEEVLRSDFQQVRGELDLFRRKYENLCRGERTEKLFEETSLAVQYTDKLVEILQRFDQAFFALKKQRGGVDFGDLEHLALQLFGDAETAAAIHSRYKTVFVDEYQDTNPLQEELISRLADGAKLFVVGDIKQSIYGFRGCEPDIFVDKYNSFLKMSNACVEELNENFRSNGQILHFVNDIFSCVMTEEFGKVNYAERAKLQGKIPSEIPFPAVQLDFVVQRTQEESVEDIYDITAPLQEKDDVTQAEVIAEKIKSFCGVMYKKDGETKRIQYGDIVVLMRSMKDKAVAVYNALVKHNIPVMANFKLAGYTNKEVRDLVNLLHVLDNPYNDIYTVGACLAPFGAFTENQLAQVKIATQEQSAPFFTRLEMYLSLHKNDEIEHKIDAFLTLIEQLRFFAHGSTVDEVVLKVLEKTNFHLYVQGLPNGGLRLRKMFAFVDQLKGASYAQSVDKFLAYLEDTDDIKKEEGMSSANAVRIMSMHASKGLEFPVVIVAGVESNFVVDYPPVESNNSLGLATKYYDFSTMRFASTLGTTACGMFNRIKQQEEEMRLLYVALTRAKVALNVVGTVKEKQLLTMPKRATSANSHLDWILSAVKWKYGKVEGAVGDEQISVVRNLQHVESVQSNCLCQQCEDIAAVEEQLNYRYPYLQQTQMPSKIVSSSLDREYIDSAPETFQPVLENNDRNFVGTAYHRVYQYANLGASREEIRATIDGLVKEDKIQPQYAAQLDVELIFQTLNNDLLRQLIGSGKVYHEMPFMLYVPYNQVATEGQFSDEVMLQGVIDLLVLHDGRATVVDFKYSTHSAEILKKSYAAQLNSYRLAVQKICGIQNVDCYILSIAENKLVKM